MYSVRRWDSQDIILQTRLFIVKDYLSLLSQISLRFKFFFVFLLKVFVIANYSAMTICNNN
jgi:hypothetical protein